MTNLRKDTEPIQVLENLAGRGAASPVGNASGVVDQTGLPRIIGRGLAAADFNNDGHVDVAINSIGGPLVLLANRDRTGNWLEVSLEGFHPGAVATATLAGRAEARRGGPCGQQLPVVRGPAAALRPRVGDAG